MSKPSLSEIEGRAEGATEGPWRIEDHGNHGEESWQIPDIERFRGYTNPVWLNEDKATATFIAAARTDVPAMAAAIRAVLAAMPVQDPQGAVRRRGGEYTLLVARIRAALAAHLDLT